MCIILLLGVLFIKQIFNGPSGVPGAVLGTVSVNKAVSALTKLPFCVQAAGTCADLERKPTHLCPGQAGGGAGAGTVRNTSRVENKDAILQRTEEQAVSWGPQETEKEREGGPLGLRGGPGG